MLWTGAAITLFFILLALFAPCHLALRLQPVPGERAPLPAARGAVPRPPDGHERPVHRRHVEGHLRRADRAQGGRDRRSSISLAVGVPLGLFSGYFGGPLDRVLVLVMDALFAFPYLLLAIVIAFLLSDSVGKGVLTAAIAITAVYMPLYFRVVRNHVISVREEPYVEAARALGAKPRTVIRQVRLLQRRAERAPDRDAQRRRRDPHACGARVPRLRHPAERGSGVGLRRQPRGLGRLVGHLVDGPLPRARDRAARDGADPARRRPERDDQPGAPAAAKLGRIDFGPPTTHGRGDS